MSRARAADAIPVLLYHSIPTSEDDDPLGVWDERFIAHMWKVIESGRVALTISQLAAALNGVIPLPERAVAITFDDGNLNNIAAVEHLLAQKLRATVYLTTGVADPARSSLEPSQIDRLAQDPERLEIGAHSVTHPRLDELDPRSMAVEVGTSKRQLEEAIGRQVASFAYPYGAYDRWVRDAVIASGYRSAVGVKNALSHPQDDPYAIARWTVRKTTSAEQIARVLDGEGALAWQGERLRTRGYRALRRLRRSLREHKPSAPAPSSERPVITALPERALGSAGREPRR